MNHAEHQHGAAGQRDGRRAVRSSRSCSSRGSAARESPQALTGGVCYCCKTTMATDSTGAMYAAWRHVYPGNIRDIAFTVVGRRPHFRAARARQRRRLGARRLSRERSGDGRRRRQPHPHRVADARATAPTPTSEPTLALFYATSADGSRFTARQRIPTDGVPRHPQMIVAPDGELLVAWDEQAKGTRRVALARGSIDGKGVARFVKLPIGDGARAEYPVLAAAGEHHACGMDQRFSRAAVPSCRAPRELSDRR